MKKMTKPMAGVAALALMGGLAACGEAPEENVSDGGDSDFLPCIVSDAGGFDDRSFNQLGFEGVSRAAEEIGTEIIDVESNSPSDYAPNLESLVGEGCNVIVAVGFDLAPAAVESANANPDVEYVLIDATGDVDNDGTDDTTNDNVKPLLYNTAEAAFMAGYAAADYTETGTVGTYGGAPIPTVTIFMDGYRQGVEYYNEQKGTDVQVVGWDGEDGSFTGGFAANAEAANTANQVLDQDVDVILPVGGPIYQSAQTAIADGADAVMLGVDADLFESDTSTQDIVFVSIRKGMDISTYEAVVAASEGDFDTTAYVGTLENEGVSLSSFHNFEGEISDTLQGELDEIETQIIDGELTVESYLDQ